jgi:magnesium and cobalt transporter
MSGLKFVVLHTKGGAVRWFKVSPQQENEAG